MFCYKTSYSCRSIHRKVTSGLRREYLGCSFSTETGSVKSPTLSLPSRINGIHWKIKDIHRTSNALFNSLLNGIHIEDYVNNIEPVQPAHPHSVTRLYLAGYCTAILHPDTPHAECRLFQIQCKDWLCYKVILVWVSQYRLFLFLTIFWGKVCVIKVPSQIIILCTSKMIWM